VVALLGTGRDIAYGIGHNAGASVNIVELFSHGL
jgi:hypothetical protein